MTAPSAPTLGSKIREARKAAGFKNPESFAVALGVSSSSVLRWETGRGEPSIARLLKIADLTEQPLAFFFKDEVAA